VPRRPLRALVLAVADHDGRALERLRRGGRVEDQLDHLPVALVQVVPVVEDVVEPVLQCELARVTRVAHDVRVDGRRVPFGDPVLPTQVVAARVESVPREVEMVLVEPLGQILGAGADRDQVAAAPRAAQRDRRVAEEQVDVDGAVGPQRFAPAVRDEPNDRGVTLGERRLVGACG
jgi:hypothetical protein